jgi:hypothetical protein
MLGEKVLTRLGKGRVAYILPDGCCLVEFDWGGGMVFSRNEVEKFLGNAVRSARVRPTPPRKLREPSKASGARFLRAC